MAPFRNKFERFLGAVFVFFEGSRWLLSLATEHRPFCRTQTGELHRPLRDTHWRVTPSVLQDTNHILASAHRPFADTKHITFHCFCRSGRGALDIIQFSFQIYFHFNFHFHCFSRSGRGALDIIQFSFSNSFSFSFQFVRRLDGCVEWLDFWWVLCVCFCLQTETN